MCSMSISSKQRATFFLNSDLLKHARAQAVVEEITLTSLIERALNKYLPTQTVIKKVEIL